MGQTAPLAIFGETKEHAVGATPAPDPAAAVRATPAPDPAAAVRAQAHAVKDALAPWHAGDDYYDFADIAAPASGVLPPAPPTAACRNQGCLRPRPGHYLRPPRPADPVVTTPRPAVQAIRIPRTTDRRRPLRMSTTMAGECQEQQTAREDT